MSVFLSDLTGDRDHLNCSYSSLELQGADLDSVKQLPRYKVVKLDCKKCGRRQWQ